MLNTSKVEANIPAVNLARAREFYAANLGLEPISEFPGAQLGYRTAAGTPFNIYETQYAGKSGHTIAQWHVDDIEAEVAELKSRGVTFEVYDMPGVDWDGEIASMPGLGRAAWFLDSENNVMCIDEPVRGA
jgi:predicted enzyme related to lactoylglutathione lyase